MSFVATQIERPFPTFEEFLEDNDIGNPIPFDRLDSIFVPGKRSIRSFFWVFDEDFGLMEVEYAAHAVRMAALYAYKNGFRSIFDMKSQRPKVFEGNFRTDLMHIGQDLYMKENAVCYHTDCSDNLQIWSDTSISYDAYRYFMRKGFRFDHTGEFR